MTWKFNTRAFLQRVQKMDTLFCWSMIGAFVGVASLVIGVYFGVFYERPAGITMDVVSQTPVLDIREDVERLDITYRGKNLNDVSLQLTVLVLRVANTGRVSILKTAFDEDSPLGYRVIDGSIAAAPQVISASTDRLNNLTLRDDFGGPHSEPSTPDDSSKSPVLPRKTDVHFPAFIFEPGEYFEHKLLIIHDKQVRPQIVSTGKIAGIREIAVHGPSDRSDAGPTWSAVTGGSLLTHLLRLFFYAAVILIAVIGIAIIIGTAVVLHSLVFIFLRNRLRERLICDFKRKHTDLGHFDAIIFNEFREGGWSRIFSVRSLIADEGLQPDWSDWFTDLRLRLTDCGLLEGQRLDDAFDARLEVFNKFISREKNERRSRGVWGWI